MNIVPKMSVGMIKRLSSFPFLIFSELMHLIDETKTSVSNLRIIYQKFTSDSYLCTLLIRLHSAE